MFELVRKCLGLYKWTSALKKRQRLEHCLYAPFLVEMCDSYQGEETQVYISDMGKAILPSSCQHLWTEPRMEAWGGWGHKESLLSTS